MRALHSLHRKGVPSLVTGDGDRLQHDVVGGEKLVRESVSLEFLEGLYRTSVVLVAWVE
jgi:hypothetical protein